MLFPDLVDHSLVSWQYNRLFLTYEGDKDPGFIAIFGSLACPQHHIIVLSISFP